MTLVIGIILIIISCIILWYSFKCQKEIHIINKNIDKENNQLAAENHELKMINSGLEQKKEYLSRDIQESVNKLQKLNQSIDDDLEQRKNLSQKAFENYFEILENAYEKTEQEYNNNVQKLEKEYKDKEIELQKELKVVQEDLKSIKATRTAAIEAQLKEQEIKEKNKFYMLTPSNHDIDDIQKLERIKPELHSPRVLSMLIWSTFFQKPMTKLCNNILGINVVTGIYKITNQKNNMCYIGQSVDIATRWKNHAKCGLGIDTPADNKLYKDMMSEGIWNFSWELLEECSKDKLNEKEKFYIELYQAKDYGYNSTKGNK